ncbi:hypothetical protein ARMGADRAFT_1004627 [Armillaria gallica]|uniref:Uncharacterized protein n=1 Tax=Armillaria gallica TaxID=47427 RepID=A0A2H3EX11_ARMGA|nr:hypothetical protein ARMGADRAFT_1004627 [Armillaria gallica]
MLLSPVSSPVLRTPSHRPIKSSPLASQSTSGSPPAFKRFPRHAVSFLAPLFGSDASTPGQSQKEFLRQRFQTRCFQRAAKARESAVKRKRHAGSDDAMDDDKEETEDEVLKDEFFQRIIEHANRRTQHAYKLSYANEVGSSLDPDMEDLGAWEAELHESESQSLPRLEELTPEEREIAELQAYADECE